MSLPSAGKFALRIVTCEDYLSAPIRGLDVEKSPFRGSPVKQTPIVRIFGSTPAGQKCCLHVHGVFPYFYVPSPVASPTKEFLQQLAVAIDAAVNSSFDNNSEKDNAKTKVERQHVYEIRPFYGMPFYGYHDEEILFLKILFYNPLMLKRAGDVLQSGSIMNTVFQPHELHVPFELKFMIDYDLYGMDYIVLKDVKFRRGSTQRRNDCHVGSADLSEKIWDIDALDDRHLMPPEVKRVSTCELEADCLVEDIIRPMNNNAASDFQNPGLRFIWKDEVSRRKALGMSDMPATDVSQDRPDTVLLPDEASQFELLRKILENTQRRHDDSGMSESGERLDDGDRHRGDDSSRNLSLGSDYSMVNMLADLMEEGTANENGAGPSGINQQLDDAEDPSDVEDEEDLLREEAEMSQRIDAFSDNDHENEEATSQRLSQCDGPPGDASESIPTIDLCSDSSDSSDNDPQVLDVVEESPHSDTSQENLLENQNSVDILDDQYEPGAVSDTPPLEGQDERASMSDAPATSYTRLRSPTPSTTSYAHRLSPDQERPESESAKSSKMVTLLAPSLKLPSRKEIMDWCVNPVTVDAAGVIVDAAECTVDDSRSSVDDPVQRDLDAIDVEEIQCRLSSDESVVVSSQMSKCSDAELDVTHHLWKTPIQHRSNSISGRRQSDDSLVSIPGDIPRKSGSISLSQPLPNAEAVVDVLERCNRTLSSPASTSNVQARRSPESNVGPNGFSLKQRDRRNKVEEEQLETPVRSPKSKKVKHNVSELDAPTPADSFGFNSSEMNLAGANTTKGAPNLTVMALEVHVHTRADLRPDPEYDKIGAIFYAVHDDQKNGQKITKGVIVCMDDEERYQVSFLRGFDELEMEVVDSEAHALDALVRTVRKYDPDILVGYELQLLSWGFIFERAQSLGRDICAAVSRIPDSPRQSWFSTRENWWAMVDCHIAGRIVLNLGRLMRHEVNLYLYSFENIVYNLLRIRVPSYDFRTLTNWFLHPKTRWRVFDHYFLWVVSELEMLNHCDVLNRSSELARLYGIQFYEVLSRGSQFRVESMLLRMAKERNYVALSPNVQQRKRMAAPGCIALTMEPESRFYTDPVVLLDFQSLYPSMMIAYNYCYSTCLGRVRNYADGDVIEFGCYKLHIPYQILQSLLQDISISPAGVAFVKSHIRRGVMPQMLEEILNTRVMVKQSAKLYKNDKSLQKILDARQLGLKMIANVTYGYTAATFSGRMPCTDISDSIVEKGRETLLRAIELVKNGKWDARVVYGDTDSLFVHLPGRTKEEAFQIGQEIVDAVTAMNPKPVKLKLEKVYMPCILQTKKRYVGYAYESAAQKEPVFDAKGIETVRRDSCPAVAKILQKALETLFISNDVSSVRNYVVRQFQRIHQGRVSPLDFMFTRKYRGREYYKKDAVAPVLLIARRRLQKDRRSEPRIKERVPYLIVAGHPGSTLISCVREPLEFVRERGLRLNYKYYITKQICPALTRSLVVLGVDTLAWYRSMSRIDRSLYGFGFRGEKDDNRQGNVRTLSQYFQIMECAVCRTTTTRDSLCAECASDPQQSAVELLDRIRFLERRRDYVYRICSTCVSRRSDISQQIDCQSTVCPITYKRTELDYDLKGADQLRRVLEEM